jgi:hypothetical protein
MSMRSDFAVLRLTRIPNFVGNDQAEIAVGQTAQKSHGRDGRLLCARRERPRRCRAANQRNELAAFQLIKWHPRPPSEADSLTDWGAGMQGLAALRDFGSADVRVEHFRSAWRRRLDP